jgi:hypothetical protein
MKEERWFGHKERMEEIINTLKYFEALSLNADNLVDVGVQMVGRRCCKIVS